MFRKFWFEVFRTPVRLALLLWLVRSFGKLNVPLRGGALVVCNHQSHLDPPAVGSCAPRMMNFLARKTLFEIPVFGPLIASINAMPIDRDGKGLGGIKESLRRLKRGEAVVVFPEGTRTPDGEIQAFRPGFTALAVRAKVPIVPVAIEGAFDVWPRRAAIPRSGRIFVYYGPPISAEDVQRMEERDLLAEVERRIRECQQRLRAHPDFANRRARKSSR